MSALNGKELRIVGFLCNWCSYGGADTAGVARASQPTDLRIIRVPCSGRVNPLFALKALLSGADGVLVSGCHPRDCHYSEGNYYARRRLEVLKEFLPIIGIDPARFEYTWVSASEGQRWKQVVTAFTDRIHKLGPAPKWDEIPSRYDLPTDLVEPLRPLGCGENPNLAELKEQIKQALKNDQDLECVLGWQEGFDPLHATPLVMRTADDVDRLIWGPLNVHSLASCLHHDLALFKDKKVGLVMKGCDSKGVMELLQESLVPRERLVLFGMGCNGTVSVDRVLAKLGPVSKIESIKGVGATLKIVADGEEHAMPMQEIAQDKCRACTVPNAVVYDHFIGKATVIPEGATPKLPAVMSLLEGLSLSERMSFWKGHMERCIRCHACRNACPMCVCRQVCVADSRDPHWLTQEDTPTQKLFFQLIHAMHLAGRCTGCAECNRSCPVGIPVGALKVQVNRIVNRLFEYSPGMEITDKPPLLGFEPEEKHIHERHIEGASS